MPFGSGLDGQIGIAFEGGAYGVYQAPTQFLEIETEGIEDNVQSLKSFPITGGRFSRTGRHRERVIGGAGPLTATVLNVGMLKLFKACLGLGVSAQVGTTPEWAHTFTPDNTDGLRGLHFTTQVGRPSTDGVVHPFSYTGGKVTQWELACAQNDFLKLTPTVDFGNVSLGQTLAVASYAAEAVPYASFDGAITIGGVAETTLKSVNIRGTNALATDRFTVGGAKLEPLANAESVISGEFSSEFNNMDAYTAWVSGTELANLVLTFTGPVIPTISAHYQIVVTVPALRYTGTAPKLTGPGLVDQSLPWEAMYNGTDPIISIEVHSDEVAI